MGLEKEVCSLEPAKRLKKLGVKQDSLFAWYQYSDSGGYKHIYCEYREHQASRDAQSTYHDGYAKLATEICAAPTVAELGEIIKRIKGQVVTYFNNYKKECHIEWVGDYDHEKDMTPNESFSADTEADARAKVVIYAKENKLIEAEGIR